MKQNKNETKNMNIYMSIQYYNPKPAFLTV